MGQISTDHEERRQPASSSKYSSKARGPAGAVGPAVRQGNGIWGGVQKGTWGTHGIATPAWSGEAAGCGFVVGWEHLGLCLGQSGCPCQRGGCQQPTTTAAAVVCVCKPKPAKRRCWRGDGHRAPTPPAPGIK